MKFLKYLLLIMLVFPAVTLADYSNSATANDFSTYVPYTGLYGYGTNMGYYGSNFTDQDISQLAYNAGARTIRLSLPDWLITGYGVNSRTTAFQYYQQIGLKDLTVFVGEPDTSNKDSQTKLFKGLYEPIWLDSAKTQVNPANTFANYLYKTVSTYGSNVKFWEIINEPDFTYSSSGWVDKGTSNSWWNVNPSPSELENLKAPVFSYIRELRVAWEVIKKLQPNSYVATGGIGYPSFLDSVLRNTDNPVDGSVTTQYPQKGGAYFDVLSYHSYPMYSLRHWDNSIFGFVYTRNSDSAVDNFIQTKNDFETDLEKYGYNGTTYPKKQYINTETDLPQKTVGDTWGSLDSANNYIEKAHILAQMNGVFQIYKYGIGESNTSDIFNTMGLYGDLSPSSVNLSNAPKTDQWAVINTLSSKLYGKTYDSAKTAQLNLPSNIRGGAFKDSNNNYIYVLWAKTTTDQSESASASYTFAETGQVFSLSGTPSFITLNQNNNVPQNQNNYIPPVQDNYISQNNYVPQNNPVQNPVVTVPYSTQGKVVVTASRLNVRKTAGGKIISTAFMGNKATVIDQINISGNIWKKVIFDVSGIMGWVSARYIHSI